MPPKRARQSEQPPSDDDTTTPNHHQQPAAEEEETDQVLLDFEILEPHERFKQGIRNLLYRYAQTCSLDVFSLTEAIIDQVNIGSVVCIQDEQLIETDEKEVRDKKKKVGEEEDEKVVLGVSTLLNVRQHKRVLKGMIKWFKQRCETVLQKESSADHTGARGILEVLANTEDRQTGLLISERIGNTVPDDLCVASIEGIIQDVKWSLNAEDCEEDEKTFYRFDDVLALLEMTTDIIDDRTKPPSFQTAHSEQLFKQAIHSVTLTAQSSIQRQHEQESPKKKRNKSNQTDQIKQSSTRRSLLLVLIPYSRLSAAFKTSP